LFSFVCSQCSRNRSSRVFLLQYLNLTEDEKDGLQFVVEPALRMDTGVPAMDGSGLLGRREE
jgi:hypothetical protein